MRITLYHNPDCSKSRETLRLIRATGIEPEIRLYLESSFSEQELLILQQKLQLPMAALMRTADALYSELGLDAQDCNDNARLRALLEHPILLNRPIAVGDMGACICRPPERVVALLPFT